MVSGGLGIACHGIVQGLLDKKIDVMLVLPFAHKKSSPQDKYLHYIDVLSHQVGNGTIDIEFVDALLQPYLTAESYAINKQKTSAVLYGVDLWAEVRRYAKQAALIAEKVAHDVIHCHDWLTVLAGIEAKKISEKPLIFHIHALEQDRSPQSPCFATQEIERQGLHAADLIITVSQYTKKRIMREHFIAAEKIAVVYNGHVGSVKHVPKASLSAVKKFTVLFLGRVTEQKGVHYFIKAAEKILNYRQDVEFIIAGEGDLLPYAIETCASLGISKYVHFSGFLDRAEVAKMYQLSDVYVMPSVSEPFGIVCLEAIAHGIPVVISKQSGVSEVLTNSLKADYWDSDRCAEHIIALLDYPALQQELLPHATRELSMLTWDNAASAIINHYHSII